MYNNAVATFYGNILEGVGRNKIKAMGMLASPILVNHKKAAYFLSLGYNSTSDHDNKVDQLSKAIELGNLEALEDASIILSTAEVPLKYIINDYKKCADSGFIYSKTVMCLIAVKNYCSGDSCLKGNVKYCDGDLHVDAFRIHDFADIHPNLLEKARNQSTPMYTHEILVQNGILHGFSYYIVPKMIHYSIPEETKQNVLEKYRKKPKKASQPVVAPPKQQVKPEETKPVVAQEPVKKETKVEEPVSKEVKSDETKHVEPIAEKKEEIEDSKESVESEKKVEETKLEEKPNQTNLEQTKEKPEELEEHQEKLEEPIIAKELNEIIKLEETPKETSKKSKKPKETKNKKKSQRITEPELDEFCKLMSTKVSSEPSTYIVYYNVLNECANEKKHAESQYVLSQLNTNPDESLKYLKMASENNHLLAINKMIDHVQSTDAYSDELMKLITRRNKLLN